jgi:hypothetical protein
LRKLAQHHKMAAAVPPVLFDYLPDARAGLEKKWTVCAESVQYSLLHALAMKSLTFACFTQEVY